MPVQTLDLGDRETVRVGFWKRQFQAEASLAQYKFDWIFGVILPVFCVFADPIIFKTWLRGKEEGLLSMFTPFAYVLSFTSIMAMMAWLIWGKNLRELNAVLAGLFTVGGLVSLGVGIILSPLSLIGLVVLIGILGFVPLFSSFVYFRNGVRAFKEAGTVLEKRVLIGAFVLSAVFSAVIPWAVNIEVDAHRPYDQQQFREFRGI
jgi:hypothetical protein